MTIDAWHFVGETLRDGSPIPENGVTINHRGGLKLCAAGYHASERLIDALGYAPGATICRVRCGGKILRDTDKLVCRQRTILWRVDGAALLREFSRKQALTVAHLWDMPAIVREYLETGDDSKRSAAKSAAVAAAETAAAAAVWAAKSAAWSAVRNAAWSAARNAVWNAAESAAVAAAAETSVWSAKGAAWSAAVAAWSAANDMLTKMVMAEKEEEWW